MRVVALLSLTVVTSTSAFVVAPAFGVKLMTQPSSSSSSSSLGTTTTTTTRTTTPTLLYAVDSIDEIELDAEERMAKSVDSVKANLNTIRTGRASASMLDRVQVEYYGVMTPLNQMASISVPSAQQLTIDPFDKKMMGDVEKALMESDLGLTPTNDGSCIRINIPALTEDRRKEMMKQCKAIGEEGKVAVRNVRRDCVDTVKKLEKKADISEDQSKDGQDALQKLTDSAVKEIDTIVSKKEKEVMTV